MPEKGFLDWIARKVFLYPFSIFFHPFLLIWHITKKLSDNFVFFFIIYMYTLLVLWTNDPAMALRARCAVYSDISETTWWMFLKIYGETPCVFIRMPEKGFLDWIARKVFVYPFSTFSPIFCLFDILLNNCLITFFLCHHIDRLREMDALESIERSIYGVERRQGWHFPYKCMEII